MLAVVGLVRLVQLNSCTFVVARSLVMSGLPAGRPAGLAAAVERRELVPRSGVTADASVVTAVRSAYHRVMFRVNFRRHLFNINSIIGSYVFHVSLTKRLRA
jgi:hypothetical protein